MIANPVVYGGRMETVKYTCTLDPKNGVTYKYLDESGQYAERSGIGEIHAVKNSIIYIYFNDSFTGWNYTGLNVLLNTFGKGVVAVCVSDGTISDL